MIAALRQRIRDASRERVIRKLGKECCEAHDRGDKRSAVRLWAAMVAECNCRSPEQVARLERAKGLRT